MLSQEYFTNYPFRLFWAGSGVLCAFVIVSTAMLVPVMDQPSFPLPALRSIDLVKKPPLSLRVDESDQKIIWELPSIENELLIALSPPRPGQEMGKGVAHIRLKNSQQSRRIFLPDRVFLSFNDQGILCFQDAPGPFWAEFCQEGSENLSVKVVVAKGLNDQQTINFSRRTDSPPLQKIEEFSLGSPLRILGESRWWGTDLVSQMGSSEPKQRIEIGAVSLDIGLNDWICWKGGKWSKLPDPSSESELPIARIRTISPQLIEWDVWDGSHARLGTPLQNLAQSHIKVDEWISSLRIRSDRQLSCSIEKQSLILHLGDWVIKENGHWRVVRRAEEKQQLINGSKNGELFILEKIDSKQNCIKGKLFLSSRTQMIPIEAVSANMRSGKRMMQPRFIRQKGRVS